MSRLLTLQEVADRTGMTLRWWRRAVFERRITVVKLGRFVRIDEADLEAFIEKSKASPEGLRAVPRRAAAPVPGRRR